VNQPEAGKGASSGRDWKDKSSSLQNVGSMPQADGADCVAGSISTPAILIGLDDPPAQPTLPRGIPPDLIRGQPRLAVVVQGSPILTVS
jgi:hypothetical protein